MTDINSRFIPLPTELPVLEKDWESMAKSISSALIRDLAVLHRHCNETRKISNSDSIYVGISGEVKFDRYQTSLDEYFLPRDYFYGVSNCRERYSTIGRGLEA